MTDVFISYKRKERPRCVAIYNALVDLKLSVWFDAHIEPGTDFDREIEREVRGAKAVLVLWSSLAADSDWIRAEARTGRQNERLVAARLDDCLPPLEFASVQAVDLFDRRDFQSGEGWRQIVSRIGRLIGRPGLGDYVRCEQAADAGLWRGWIAANPDDPLVDMARQRAAALGSPADRGAVSPPASPAVVAPVPAADPARHYWPMLAGGVLMVGAVLVLAFGGAGGAGGASDAADVAAKSDSAATSAQGTVTPMASAGQGKLAFCRPDKPYVLRFAPGRTDMPPAGNLTISNIWLAWRECRGPVRVEGYGDAAEGAAMAATVATELRGRGVDPQAISPVGKLAGAGGDRRVEVYLLPPR
ncbi:MAG: toll/interleukin-1 receptor domain-containing protein [Sphingomonadales bacterium]|nr:toll/interleukin-1 receptor domain-containing protein [Sphingomonadales bacterium]